MTENPEPSSPKAPLPRPHDGGGHPAMPSDGQPTSGVPVPGAGGPTDPGPDTQPSHAATPAPDGFRTPAPDGFRPHARPDAPWQNGTPQHLAPWPHREPQHHAPDGAQHRAPGAAQHGAPDGAQHGAPGHPVAAPGQSYPAPDNSALVPGPPSPPYAAPPVRRRVWPAVVGVAALSAVLASAGTAGALALIDRDTSRPSSLSDIAKGDSNSEVPVPGSTSENPNWEAVTKAVADSVVALQVSSGQGSGEGSGVIIDAEGHILTNNHVVAGAQKVQVTLNDGRLYEATVVGTDPTTDLAVVKLVDPPQDLVPATLGDSSKVAVGESVLAVGNPLGLANTSTTGIVSALNRPVSASGEDGSSAVVTNAIQIDAAINPGNSGGPLFNAQGEVIGITSSIATVSAGGKSGSIGLGFAIPVNLAKTIRSQLIENGTAEHAFLGVSLSDSTASADGVTRRGAKVEDVSEGSPAAKAGIRAGDVVVAIDGHPVGGASSLTGFVRELAAGDTVPVTVVRDGDAVDIDVTLAAKKTEVEPGSGQGNSGEQGPGMDPTNPNNVPGFSDR